MYKKTDLTDEPAYSYTDAYQVFQVPSVLQQQALSE